MNAGKFKPIELWGNVETTNELLETDISANKIRTVWAELIPRTGAMLKGEADTIISKCTHKFKMRYGSGKDIEEDMWFVYRGQRFDIKFILNPRFKDESLEIFVEEVVR
ncbi:phage head closure protein [Paenibacillus aquistagni]|uniref:phage head closure protein n=1 Tax=Paenibacillus aquistagni TaxID=1852522 RepID=UPI00145BB61C|nr:phage head closure protein [Paenibacillus aquistagni]NMM52149.1 phage head closure protein [Paenibacillus aquistagni]